MFGITSRIQLAFWPVSCPRLILNTTSAVLYTEHRLTKTTPIPLEYTFTRVTDVKCVQCLAGTNEATTSYLVSYFGFHDTV